MKRIYTFLLFTFLFSVSNLYSQTYVSGYITENTTWNEVGSPYIIKDSLIVNEGVELKIDTGAIVLFKYHTLPEYKTYMTVYGGIKIKGSNDKPVVFTSERDNSLGDILGTSKTTIPREGDWGFIKITRFNGQDNVEFPWIENAHFRYGGGRAPDTLTSAENYPMILMYEDNNNSGRFDFGGCEFSHSKGVAIRLGSSSVNSSVISNSNKGVHVTRSNGILTNTAIKKNKKFPVFFEGLKVVHSYQDNEFVDWYGITCEENGLNYFAIGGDVINVGQKNGDINIHWSRLSIPYFVTSKLNIIDQDVTIDGGTIIKFKYFSEDEKKPSIIISNDNYLKVDVTDDETVFTSEFDFSYELKDQKYPKPKAGDWGYIQGSGFEFENCIFKYGGVFYNSNTNKLHSDSSSVIRIIADLSRSSRFKKCLFTELYSNAIRVLAYPNNDHPVSVNNSSFLINKEYFGIILDENYESSNTTVDAINNYWYGALGPYEPESNPDGNGCKVDKGIDYRPFITESDDLLKLISSKLYGKISEKGSDVPIKNAMLKLIGKYDKKEITDDQGLYLMHSILPGYGYDLKVYAANYIDTTINNISIEKDNSYNMDIELVKKEINYQIDTISFKVNPDTSFIEVGGVAHRYYKIVDVKTKKPEYGVEVFVNGLDETFFTNEEGIVDIPISWEEFTNNSIAKRFYISKVGEDSEMYDPKYMDFIVHLLPREYEKMWGGKFWLKGGVSILECSQESEAGIGVLIQNDGQTERVGKLKIERAWKEGVGINFELYSAKAEFGSLEAGSEVKAGVNIGVFLKDEFEFDYENTDGRVAFAKFIALGGAAFSKLDAPLLRFLTVGLVENFPEVQDALESNSVGVVAHGQITAEAKLSASLKDSLGIGSPIKAEIGASAEANADTKLVFTNHTSGELEFHLSREEEYEIGASAAFGWDIMNLLGNDKNKSKNDDGIKLKEIDLPMIVEGHAEGGVKFGASIRTHRSIPNAYTTLGLMYGYKYALGDKVSNIHAIGFKQDREYHLSFDFHDKYLKEIIEEKVGLAKELASSSIENLDLNVSSMSGGDFFKAPFSAFANEQVRNAFSFPPVPYQHKVKDVINEGSFDVKLSFGLGPVSCKIGGGLDFSEENSYLWHSGAFYNWQLYPLQTYDYVESGDSFLVAPIVLDILTESGKYLWEQIQANLVPPVFKKIPFWPFTLLKNGNDIVIPIGPESRSSHVTANTINSEDSIFVYYWDWYGTEGVPESQLKLKSAKLKTLSMVKSAATNVHKLDYGIGGFYQFEPNGKIITDSVELTINYDDEELKVMLSDSSLYNINEEDLCMYVEDKTNSDWIYIGGVVDSLNNTITARIDSFATFTLAPFVPVGEMELFAEKDTIKVEELNSVNIYSNSMYYNTGEPISDGEEFTIEASRGKIITPDENLNVEGIQVKALNDSIRFAYESDSLSGNVFIKASSRRGKVSGLTTIFIEEENAPQAPVLLVAKVDECEVDMQWETSPDTDVQNYLIYFGTNQGGPYNGVASVLGEASPVKVGTITQTHLKGLSKDSTYYFAIKAVDRCGNTSGFSNELELKMNLNHRPIIYKRIFNIEQSLSNGTIIDTIWAKDEDKGQILKYYKTSSNLCSAFDVDSESGIITVIDSDQLNYRYNQVDTFRLEVGVVDDAQIPLSDSATIVIALKNVTGIEEVKEKKKFAILYPNPAMDKVTVEGTFDRILIYNLNGKLIKITEKRVVQCEELGKGIFLFKIIRDTECQTEKVIIL